MKIGIVQGGKFKELIPIIKPLPPVAEKERIIVSGTGTPATVLGEYEIIDENATTYDKVWKHITQEFYIKRYSGNFWCINTSATASDATAKFAFSMVTTHVPYPLAMNAIPINGASGTVQTSLKGA